MNRFVDLHCHTTFSDGHDTPSELVKMAAENDVSILGVTDHDNLGGLPGAIAAGKEHGIMIVSGVETSTSFHGQTIHVLGYGIPQNDAGFKAFLEKIYAFRKDAVIQKMKKISSVFVAEGKEPIDIDDFVRSQGSYFNKEKAAEYLIVKGYLSDEDAAYKMVTQMKAGAAFPASSAEAVAAIHKVGGLAILAHPFARGLSLRAIDPTLAGQEKLLKEMVAAGIDGIECYQSEYGPEETALALALAEKYDLLASAGSDWHGAICDVPGDITERKNDSPEHVGGLGIAPATVAPLLERLGVGKV